MKLTIETVVKGISAIAVNYTLEASEAYQDLIFEQLKDKLTDDEFNEACKAIICQESISYNKMPNIGVFLKYSGKQELDPKEQAILEVSKIINHVDVYYDGNPVIFENTTTNACVNGYGGIVGIAREVNSQAKRDWIVKSLEGIWKACFHDGITENYCRGRTPQKYHRHVKGKFYKDPQGCTLEGVLVEEKLTILFVGDEAKCQKLLDKSQKLLEEPKNPEMEKIIAKLEEGGGNK